MFAHDILFDVNLLTCLIERKTNCVQIFTTIYLQGCYELILDYNTTTQYSQSVIIITKIKLI